jgi:uncharacterized protein
VESRPEEANSEMPRRRRWRWIALGVAAIAAVTLVLGAVGWHFSDDVLVPNRSGWPEDVRVEAVLPHSVVLERTAETERPGLLGLDWQAGHAIARAVLAEDEDTVTRRLSHVRGFLVSGLEIAIDWNVYAGNPKETLGLAFSTVPIESELGPMPAWLIPGAGVAAGKSPPGAANRDGTWAIFVHGINSSRQTGLRIAPELHREGLPTLVISYRDDLGAPSSPDGFHHMGLTEWRDLQAASQYALAHGAKRLVLVGYSMGGAIVAQFMERSPLADRVAALVLDAPALDWKAILSFNATEMGFPSLGAIPVEWAIGARIDADWDSLDALQHTDDFHLPILLFHGGEDPVVPISTSEQFARELPEWVTYYRVPKAGHTQSWNVNPGLYERRLSIFLQKALKRDGSSQFSSP